MELWKAFKSSMSAPRVNKTVQYDTNLVLGGFKDYYTIVILALLGTFWKRYLNLPNKFILNIVIQNYKCIIQSNSFNLATIFESTKLTVLKNTKVCNASGLDNLPGCFLWKIIHWLLRIIFRCQNYKGFRPRFDYWHDLQILIYKKHLI